MGGGGWRRGGLVVADKALTVRRGALDAEALSAFRVAMRHDTTGGLQSLSEVLAGAEITEVLEGDQVVLRYALRAVARANGSEVFVVAAAGSVPGVDLTQGFLPVIEAQAKGADALTIHTRRPGMVEKLKRAGWHCDGYIMRKKMR